MITKIISIQDRKKAAYVLIVLAIVLVMGRLNVGTASQPLKKNALVGHSLKKIKWAKAGNRRGLIFPFANPDNMLKLYSFGLYPWSPEGEVHGGIDLIPEYEDLAGTDEIRKEAVVAPIGGMISDIVQGETGHGVPSFVVILQVDFYWYVILNFEPQSDDPAILAEQQNSIVVEPGHVLKQGDRVGDLVVSGSIVNDAYPHLHYSLFYKHPADSFDYLFANSVTLARDDGTTVPLRWQTLRKGHKMTIPTTFFCPYEFSTSNAKMVMEEIPVTTLDYVEPCDCVCAYSYIDGVCETCGQ